MANACCIKNKKPLIKCTNCNSTWCADPNCLGASGKRQLDRQNGQLCASCMKRTIKRL